MNNLNKRGFTLVELLATIVILGIISVIAVVSVDKMLDHSNETTCDNLLLTITNAAKDYASDKRFLYTEDEIKNGDIISVKELTVQGYLSQNMDNPFTNKSISDTEKDNIKVNIKFNSDYTVKGVQIKNYLDKIIQCHIDDDKTNGVVLFPG